MGSSSRALSSLGIITLSLTFLLILMGALVTNNEAGDSVPDWPLAYGRMVPIGHLQGPVVFEYFHRVVAGSVGILTIVLAAWAFVRENRAAVRIVSAAAVVGIVGQALLGGVRVRLGESHSFGIATAHAFTAQAFLCILTALVVLVSPRWQVLGTARGHGETSRTRAARMPPLPRNTLAAVSLAAAGALLLQALAGAGFRHRILDVAPHVAGAVLAAGLVVAVWIAARRAGAHAPDGSAARMALVPARLALWSVGAQIVLGPLTYFLLRGLSSTPAGELPPEAAAAVVIPAVLHLGLGSALIVETTVLSLWSLRASRSA